MKHPPILRAANNPATMLLIFGAGGFDMKVLELQPAKRVLWQVVDGPRNGSAQK
jgi:hypothetical protein